MKANGTGQSVVEEPSSVRRVAGPVLVLLGAVAVGVAVRQYRVLSSYHQESSAPVVGQVRPIERPHIEQRAQETPGSGIVDEAEPVEEGFVEVEAVVSEPVVESVDEVRDSGVESRVEAAKVAAAEGAIPEQERLKAESVMKEQRGRSALAGIGHDREADEIWIRVINDPSVSENARSNLIEDLNEDGLSNPSNPTMADLPVIVYRIGLIEGLAPNAMDQVNADAFAEAHKDLVNMANRLMRR